MANPDWGGLRPPSKFEKPVIDSNWIIYVLIDDYVIAFKDNQSWGHSPGKLPDFIFWAGAVICQNCGKINIVEGEAESSLNEIRDMGADTFYVDDSEHLCEYCKAEFGIEIQVDQYAMSWFVQLLRSENCKFIGIEALNQWIKDAMEYKAKYRSLNHDNNKLRERIGSLSSYAESFLRYLDETGGFLLIIEGKDEEVIWRQVLEKLSIDIKKVSILKYGEGGKDEAIKLTSTLKKPVLNRIPHYLILDSDGDKPKKIAETKKTGLSEDEFYVLDKKEIESYLFDLKAIAKLLNVSEAEILSYIKLNNLKLRGKEELEKIFFDVGHFKANSEIKGLIVKHMEVMPDEFNLISQKIESALKEKQDLADKYYNESYSYEFE